ncbi:integrase-like protein [Rhizobium sp. PP-CC-3A-592]|nr:integrase-like protein [Rhizobium sp. PP-CC-3A-592]
MDHMPAESQFVTFSLGEELFAVPVTVVREILDHEDPFKIPHGPDYLMGLRDVRGQGVPIIDLRLRLGMTPTVRTPHTRILVLDIPLGEKDLALGLVADKVFKLTPFRRTIKQARNIIAEWTDDYNSFRPHSSPGFQTLADYAEIIAVTCSNATQYGRFAFRRLLAPCHFTSQNRRSSNLSRMRLQWQVIVTGSDPVAITAFKENSNSSRSHYPLGNITPSEFAMKMAVEK